MRTAGWVEGADLRTIGGSTGGVSKMLDLAALTLKMSPCDGTGVPLLSWVRLMFTYHATYTFIYIKRITPSSFGRADSLAFIPLFPRTDYTFSLVINKLNHRPTRTHASLHDLPRSLVA